MNTALPGLSTYNWEESGQPEVIALVEGDEARIEAFLKAIEKNKPEFAEVSKVPQSLMTATLGEPAK